MVKLLVILIAVLVCFILYKNKTEKVNNEKVNITLTHYITYI